MIIQSAREATRGELIQRIKDLEKENKKLTEARNWYFEHTVNKAVTPEMLHKILREDYVPKSVIREKIEELRKEKEKVYKLSFSIDRMQYLDFLNGRIFLLESLLGEDK